MENPPIQPDIPAEPNLSAVPPAPTEPTPPAFNPPTTPLNSSVVGMPASQDSPDSSGITPEPVIATYSTRGLEYFIMLISLGIAASSLGSLLHSSVNQLFNSPDELFGTTIVSLASAALVVTLPIFTFLFLRLKRAELAHPNFKSDPSRKRAVQIMIVLTFLVGIGNVIAYLYAIFNAGNADDTSYLGSGASGIGITGNLVHLLITLVIAGSIFAYYWYDEHRRG